MPFSAFEAEHRNDKQKSIHFDFSLTFWYGGQQFRIRFFGMINLNSVDNMFNRAVRVLPSRVWFATSPLLAWIMKSEPSGMTSIS
jgi:hypothetical protein